MRRFIFVALFLIPAIAEAADVTVTVPNDFAARIVAVTRNQYPAQTAPYTDAQVLKWAITTFLKNRMAPEVVSLEDGIQRRTAIQSLPAIAPAPDNAFQ